MANLLRLVVYLFLCVSLNSFAALSIRDLDGDWSNGHEGVYDDVLDITWLADANYAEGTGFLNSGRFDWWGAELLAQNLVIGNFDNWRLPSILNSIDEYANNMPYQNELNHIFQESLNYTTGGPFSASFVDSNTGDTYSFINAQYTGHTYWFQEEWTFSTSSSHFFYGPYGPYFSSADSRDYRHVWPVHDGDIGLAPVPLPAGIYLFLSGLVGLGLMRARKD